MFGATKSHVPYNCKLSLGALLVITIILLNWYNASMNKNPRYLTG